MLPTPRPVPEPPRRPAAVRIRISPPRRAPLALLRARPGLVIFAVALLLRLGWVLCLGNTPRWIDEQEFVDIARRLAHGQGYVAWSYRANPIEPAYLAGMFALFGERLVIARIGQALLGAATCVLIYRIGALLVGPAVGIVAGGLLAVYLPHVYLAGVFYVDCVLTFLSVLSVYLALRSTRPAVSYRLGLASGVTLGLVALTRALFILYLPCVCAAWLYGAGRAWRRVLPLCLAAVAGAALVMAPWAIRNQRAYGRPLLVSSGFGTHLWQGNNPLARGDAWDRYLWTTEPVWRERLAELPEAERRPFEDEYAAVERRVAEGEARGEDAMLAYDEALGPLAVDWMRSHPARAAALALAKVRTLFSAFTSTWTQDEHAHVYALAAGAIFYPLLALAAAGLCLGIPRRRALAVLYLAIGAVVGAYAVLTTCTRFRLPIDPFLIVFAALAIDRIRTGPAIARRPGALLAIAAFVAVAAVVTARLVANLNVPGQPGLERWGFQDFRDAAYYPAVAFLDGHNPYDATAYLHTYPVGYSFPLYLPLALVLHLPLAFLPFEAAEVAYWALLLGLMLAIARVTLGACGLVPTVTRTFALAAALLASRPGQWSLSIGQCSTLAVLGVCLALGYGRERPWLGGLGLALGAFKPTFGAPLAVLMAVRGDLRAVTIGVAIAAIVSAGATAALAAAAGGPRPFLDSLLASHAAFSAEASVDPTTSWSRIDAAALVGRALGHPPTTALALAIGLAVLALGALATARLGGERRLSTSVICLTVLACTYHQGYDLLLLALPLAALVAGRSSRPWRTRPGLHLLLLGLLALPAVNYLCSQRAIDFFGLTGGWWLAVTSLNGAAVLAALLVLAGLALCRPA